MRFTPGARVRVFVPLMLSLLPLGCTNADDARVTCTRATEHYELLRLVALKSDPVLSQAPELAAEHARQTRAVFTAPIASRCATDAALTRCVTESSTYQQAQACL